MNEKKFDYKQLKATGSLSTLPSKLTFLERVVEINQILNGAEGPELKAFGFHLQNVRFIFSKKHSNLRIISSQKKYHGRNETRKRG